MQKDEYHSEVNRDWFKRENFHYLLKRAAPVLEEFKAWLEKRKDQTPPKGLLGQATGYVLSFSTFHNSKPLDYL